MALQKEENKELSEKLEKIVSKEPGKFWKESDLRFKKKKAKNKAKELLKNFTLFLGDNGALKEYWTDKLEAKRNASLAIAEIYKLPLKVGQYLDNEKCIEMYFSFWEDVKEELEKL